MGGGSPPRGIMHPFLSKLQNVIFHLSYGAVIAPSKVISGLQFAHHLHLTNTGDPGILEIIIVQFRISGN